MVSAPRAKCLTSCYPSDYPFPGCKLVRTMPTTCLSQYTLRVGMFLLLHMCYSSYSWVDKYIIYTPLTMSCVLGSAPLSSNTFTVS